MASSTTVHSIASALEWIDNNTSTSAIFRGQCDAQWELESRIARNPLGRKVELSVLEEFKRLSRPFLAIEPKNNLEWLAIAQHHGLHTRLLDWTTNPLAALWFAAKDYKTRRADARLWTFLPDHSVELGESRDACWADPFSQTIPFIVHPPQISPRIISQNGCFTLQPFDRQSNEFVSLNTIENLVDSVVIPYACLEQLVLDLNRCGVNESFLFPGLDSLARHIVWRNSI
jgi:hypothetical protein